MSSNTVLEQQARLEAEHKHYAGQSAQWREIGINAVAAAAQYSPARDDKEKATQERKVVTLRDIDFLAA
ncbi:hypothetical protein GCM10007301_48740 [Azorhizobium oxalatiphilum]|uniref:Uncharacterized protein n=1 Tax=Azorhizobium oxalatiphilum TaxID=980631 RepID=A0A917FHZ3_9HYPH|nr:hypothetical protein [Azorhizobium oxalatiphilum]GGF82868.1 hypothetical protein GCM10007301_48740 [Azorhizobium oxalatiphilum]